MNNKRTFTSKNNQPKKRSSEMTPKVDNVILKKLAEKYIFPLEKQSARFPKAIFKCEICPYHMDDVERAMKHTNDTFHIKNLKAAFTMDLMKYLPAPTENQINAVNDCIDATMSSSGSIFISETEKSRREKLCDEMKEIANEMGCQLKLCGSLLTGLSIINVSDVNLYLDNNNNNINKKSYLNLLKSLSESINNKLKLKTEIKLEKLNNGLFCEDLEGVTYHISKTTQFCQLTSELIKLYIKIDQRAEKLIKLFRFFANQAFIDRTQDGFFPVEVLSILVIFYLQQLPQPILPNLHKLATLNNDLLTEGSVAVTTVVIKDDYRVKYVSDLSLIQKLWTPPINKSTIGELWIDLLRFYTVEFDSNQYMVSIRSVCPLLKSDRNIMNKKLAVDDPFDLKRNLLFSWNNVDVIDFVREQWERCYIYFGVPQLINGKAAFSRVLSSKECLPLNCLSTPTFSSSSSCDDDDNFFQSIELIEGMVSVLYEEVSGCYDVRKWPVKLFVKMCLEKILVTIFDVRRDRESFTMLLEPKTPPLAYFAINCYEDFRVLVVRLSLCILKDFCRYFQATDSWTQPDIDSGVALDIIKKAAQRFINESQNKTLSDNDSDDNDYEMNDIEDNEIEIDLTIDQDDEEEVNDEPDTLKETDNIIENKTTVKEEITESIINQENWKLPISFKLIKVQIKGFLESGSEEDVYNEHRVQSIQRDQIKYSFSDIPIYRKKLEIVCSFCNGKWHRKECCKDAIPRFDEMKSVLKQVNPQWLKKLNLILTKKYESTLPSKERREANEKIFNNIDKVIKNLYPAARSQMFGSSHNGFMNRASDIDICLEFLVDNKRQKLANKEITTILKKIGRDLKKCFVNIDVAYILHAKVPIIKFYLKDNVQGDISINNSLAIENTKMLKLYADLYPSVKSLGNLIKFVAKSCDIGDASQGTLSSYAYIVMLVHFLQKRGLLPVLQELFEDDIRPSFIVDGWDAWYQSNIEIIYKLWKPTQKPISFEYLWLDFFYYFAIEFDIDKEVVSIKQSTPLYKIDKNWQMSYMAIEDPFDLNHNLSGSLSLEKCRYILQSFAHVLKIHSNNDNLSNIDSVLNMLMEPNVLRPNVISSRTCYQCNKQGHVARDCTDKSFKRSQIKNGISIQQQEFPKLSPPFHYKESSIANHLYLNADSSKNDLTVSSPLSMFNKSIDEFSVVPIRLMCGDKSIIIPMVIGKDSSIFDNLDNMFQNSLQTMCSLPVEILGNNVKMMETMQLKDTISNTNNVIITNNNAPANSVAVKTTEPIRNTSMKVESAKSATANRAELVTNTGFNNKKPLPKQQFQQIPQQNKPLQNEYFISQFNRFGQSVAHHFPQNQARFMGNNLNSNNMGNMNQYQMGGPYNHPPPGLSHVQGKPQHYNNQYNSAGQQRSYQDYQALQQMQMNTNTNRQQTSNTSNVKYPSKGGNNKY